MSKRVLFLASISDRFPFPEYVQSIIGNLVNALSHLSRKGYGFVYGDVIGVQRHSARNELVDKFIESGDHPDDRLLFVDTDMVFPNGFIPMLMDLDLPVVGGFYVKRLDPGYPLAYSFNHYSDDGLPVYDPMVNLELGKTYLCHASGAGCLMIKRSVIDQLEKPLFHHKPPYTDVSEEMAFYGQLMEQKIPFNLTTKVVCTHANVRYYGWEIYDRMRKAGRWDNGKKEKSDARSEINK